MYAYFVQSANLVRPNYKIRTVVEPSLYTIKSTEHALKKPRFHKTKSFHVVSFCTFVAFCKSIRFSDDRTS